MTAAWRPKRVQELSTALLCHSGQGEATSHPLALSSLRPHYPPGAHKESPWESGLSSWGGPGEMPHSLASPGWSPTPQESGSLSRKPW